MCLCLFLRFSLSLSFSTSKTGGFGRAGRPTAMRRHETHPPPMESQLPGPLKPFAAPYFHKPNIKLPNGVVCFVKN